MSAASQSRRGLSDARGVGETGVASARLRAVVLSLDTFGDLTLRQPLLRALLDAGHAVAVCVRAAYAELLPYLDARLVPIITEVEPYRPPAWPATRSRLQHTRDEIAAFKPQLLIAGPYSRTFADEWLLRSFPAAERVGLLNPAATGRLAAVAPPSELAELPVPEDALFTDAVTVQRDSHESDKYRALATRLAALDGACLGAPLLEATAHDHARAQAELRRLCLAPGRYLAVAAVGTHNTPIKQPGQAVIDAIVERAGRSHDLAVLLIGSHDELPAMREIAQRHVRCAAWSGGSGDIGTLLGLLAGARAYAGADTGPMHFASALGLPVLALFGGGHWPRFLPMARRAVCVRVPIPCFGCEWSCCFGEPLCLTAMQPDIVADALDRLLDDGAHLTLEVDGVASTALPLLRHAVGVAQSAVEARTRRFEDADADRAARLTQIETLTAQLRVSEADRVERGRQIDELQRIAATLREESGHRLQQVLELTASLASSEHDRADRMHQIDTMNDLLMGVQEESAQRLHQVEKLDAWLRGSQSDGAARLQQVQELTARLASSEHDRAERLRQIDTLSRLLAQSQQESAQRQAQILALTDMARRFEAESAARMVQIEQLTAMVNEARADLAARVPQLDTELAALRRDLAEAEAAGRALEARLQDVIQVADRLVRRPGARLVARLLRWGEVEQLAQITRPGPLGEEQGGTDTPRCR